MSVKIIIKEEKEQLNELLGAMLAWGLIATLIGKLLGFKFNLQSDDQMTKWGFSLGEAFKFSRQKLKNAGLSPDVQSRVETILSGTEARIKNHARTEMAAVRANPGHQIVVDRQITAFCDQAVSDIDRLIKDPVQSRNLVEPIRKTFEELTGSLDTVRRESVLNALNRDPQFRRRILATLTRLPAADRDAVADTMITRIAENISRSLA